MIKMLVL